jgi:hypothetical protein
MGLNESIVGKVADYAILGALVGASGGAFGMGIGAVPGMVVGTLVGAMVGVAFANMQVDEEEENSEVPLGSPSDISQEASEILDKPKKGGGVLKTIGEWTGLSETRIDNVAWCSILGADAGLMFGPVGIIGGAVVGAIIGAVITKEEPDEISSPGELNQQESSPINDSKVKGGGILKSIKEWIQVEDSAIANVAGCAIIGLEIGCVAGPIGIAVGTIAGGLVGLMLEFTINSSKEDESTTDIKSAVQIDQRPSDEKLLPEKGGGVLQMIKNMGKKLGEGELAATATEYAILGGIVGAVGGPIGIAAGIVLGGVVGGVLSKMEVHEGGDHHAPH